MEKQLHALIYKSSFQDQWVAICVEYDIASQGDSREHALAMIREAVELHLDGISKEQLEQIDNEVGSEPVVQTFSVRAPSILK